MTRPARRLPERAELSIKVQDIVRAYLDDTGLSRAWLAKVTGMSPHTTNKMFGEDYVFTVRGLSDKNVRAFMDWPELPAQALPLLERLLYLSPRGDPAQ